MPFAAHAAEGYTIDPQHSFVNFSASHFWFATTHGRFDKISGKVTLDSVAKTGSVDITIDAGSINTDMALRDKNLRSPNFFDVAKFPSISYQSSVLIFSDDTLTGIAGNLTLLGVTKPVTLTINPYKCDTNPINQKERCRTAATTQIKRTLA